jgi:putative ATP-dependent DNA ligase
MHVEEGTLIFLDPIKIIRGYPKIRRALCLVKALTKYFEKGYVLEEKVDGYNVRVVAYNKKIYAITKGGLICPYTSDLVQFTRRFFKDHPNLVICGEVIGRFNPYVMHDYDRYGDCAFLVFDIREEKTNMPLSVKKRRNLCRQYGLSQVPMLPKDDILSLVKKLDAEGKEGLVIKSPDMKRQMKYTTSTGNIGDLKYAFQFPFDFGKSFFFRRILREAFQSHELGEDDEAFNDRALRLGRAILWPMRQSIKKVAQGKQVFETNIIKGKPKVLRKYIKHLENQNIDFTHELKDNLLIVKRLPRRTNDKIKNYLFGQYCEE